MSEYHPRCGFGLCGIRAKSGSGTDERARAGFGIISPITTAYTVGATGGFAGAFIVAACLLIFGATVSLVMTRHPGEPEHAVAGLAAQAV